MKRFIIACAAIGVLLAVASCTGSSTTSVHSADSPGTYLAKDKSQVAFIQWRTVSRGHVAGTLTADNIGGAAPAASLSQNSVPFTGTVSGNSVNLTFASGLFLQNHAQGTLTGNTLTLAIPHADGTIHRTTFTQSSRSRYNRAVAALHASAQHENQLAAQGDSNPSANIRAVQHNTQTNLAALYQASSLAPRAKLTKDVDRFAGDAATARSRLATEKQATLGDNRYCAATSTAVGISHGVSGTALSAMGDSQALKADIAAIRIDIRNAGTNQRRLSRAGQPGSNSEPELIATAETSMSQAIASANSYIDQINATNSQARVVANRMATGKCSGPGQAAVTAPVAHIR
jgi:hypothetical protein